MEDEQTIEQPILDDTSANTDVESNNDVETNAEQETTLADGTSNDKPIPYHVWREERESSKQEIAKLRDELTQLRTGSTQTQQQPQVDPNQAAQLEQAKAVLKQMGFVSQDDIVRQQQDQKLASQLSELEKKYDGKNGLPKFDRRTVIEHAQQTGIFNPEVAYKNLHEAEWADHLVKQAIAKSKGVSAEGSNGSGSQNVGTTNSDLRAAASKGDKSARNLLLKRISADVLARSR